MCNEPIAIYTVVGKKIIVDLMAVSIKLKLLKPYLSKTVEYVTGDVIKIDCRTGFNRIIEVNDKPYIMVDDEKIMLDNGEYLCYMSDGLFHTCMSNNLIESILKLKRGSENIRILINSDVNIINEDTIYIAKDVHKILFEGKSGLGEYVFLKRYPIYDATAPIRLTIAGISEDNISRVSIQTAIRLRADMGLDIINIPSLISKNKFIGGILNESRE